MVSAPSRPSRAPTSRSVLGRLVHTDIGGLCGENHGSQEFERTLMFKLGFRLGHYRLQALEKFIPVCKFHSAGTHLTHRFIHCLSTGELPRRTAGIKPVLSRNH